MDVNKAFVSYCDTVKVLRGVLDEWTYQDLFHLACGIEGMAVKGWDREGNRPNRSHYYSSRLSGRGKHAR